MCNTSGIPFYEQPVEVLDWGIDVNLKGPIYFARALWGHGQGRSKRILLDRRYEVSDPNSTGAHYSNESRQKRAGTSTIPLMVGFLI